MTTTIENDLVTLRERRRQLADRLEDLRTEQTGILDDVLAAEQDFLDSIETGEDSALLGERLKLRKRELSNNRTAVDHLTSVMAGVDSQIDGIEARQRLADDTASYHAALASYTDALPALPSALPTAVEVVGTALTELIGEIDGARTTHDQLSGTAQALRLRTEQLGTDVDALPPPSWTTGVEGVHHRDAATRQLALALLQRRGPAAVLAEITRLILLDVDAKRKAAR